MAAKTTYTCDLCGRPGPELVGIGVKDDYRVDREGDEPAPRKVLVAVGVMLAAKHLCRCCIRDVKDISYGR